MTATATLRREDFDFVRQRVEAVSGIVLDDDKLYLVETRLQPLLRRLGFVTTEQMVRELRQKPDGELLAQIVEAMTTNETSFFRDGAVFEALRTGVIPELIRRNAATRRIDLWCAASSSGQEPYSVLMLLREHFPELATWTVRYVVSDISREMLERTRSGVYTQHEVNRGLPAALLIKYFDRRGLEWQVKPELRRMLDIRCINLVEQWPAMPKLDVVMIRNVMIYFDVETKKRILDRIQQVLRPDGFLFLGSAETPRLLTDGFRRATPLPCYRHCC